MQTLTPTLHKPVPLDSRVKIPSYFHKDKPSRFGKVVGIASMHVIFTYIVLLDKPLETQFGTVEAVVVNGSELESVTGENWKLNSN